MNASLRFWIMLAVGLTGLGCVVGLLALQDDSRKLVEEIHPPEQTLLGPSAAARSEGTDVPPITASLARGVGYLIKSQHVDGGWHSEAYGQLRGGAAVSALVLYALSHAPDELREPHREPLERGYDFLRQGLQSGGFIANSDGSADYPTYATAMTLVAAERLELLDEDTRSRLLEYVARSQLSEEEGWKPDDEHYGGWDMVGPSATAGLRITPGTNLSVTTFALEALASASGEGAKAARAKSAVWLAGCQNLDSDGGFVFSPVRDDPGNKAGTASGGAEQRGQGTEPRDEGTGSGKGTRLAGQLAARSEEPSQAATPYSYGTMTADGLRSLIYSGYTPDSAEVQAALDWLQRHPGLDVVPGFEHLPPEIEWQRGLQFYYFASLAKADAVAPSVLDDARWQQLARILFELQREDGRWENDSSRMREDDPLIATALAVIALSGFQRATTGNSQ